MPEFMCPHGSVVDLAAIDALPDYQGSVIRHKCAACAYQRGLQDGIDAAELAFPEGHIPIPQNTFFLDRDDVYVIWAFLLAGVKNMHVAQDTLSAEQWQRAHTLYDKFTPFIEEPSV